MVANERPKWKNARSKLTKLVLKQKGSDDNNQSPSCKEEVVSIDDNST